MYRCPRNLKLNQGFLGLFMLEDVSFCRRTLVPSVSGLNCLSQKPYLQRDRRKKKKRRKAVELASLQMLPGATKHAMSQTQRELTIQKDPFPVRSFATVEIPPHELLFQFLLPFYVDCTLWPLHWFSLTATSEYGCHRPESRKIFSYQNA